MIEPARLLPLRHRFVQAVRDWFHGNGFTEVETPIAVLSPGMEPHLDAFELRSVAGQEESTGPLYLHTSPEYHMKRILASYPEPIFQVCHCFRDEPPSRLHNHEFTMLEWYRPLVDYTSLMEDCQDLIASLAMDLLGVGALVLGDRTVSLDRGFERLSVKEAFLRWTGIDPFAADSRTELAESARSAGFEVPDHWPWEDIFHFLLLEAIEGRLGSDRPTILFDYPTRLASLSRVVGGAAQRFELYIAGQELANAFSELVDPEEQRRRFTEDQALRSSLARPVYPIDEKLLEALGRMEQAAGIALGLDRLWLLFCEHLLGRRLTLAEVMWGEL